jgi:hypothetical protein
MNTRHQATVKVNSLSYKQTEQFTVRYRMPHLPPYGVKENVGIHNFYTNYYQVPVTSDFKTNKFKEMAGDYWDQQLFDLIKFGFSLDVGDGFQSSNEKQIMHLQINSLLRKISTL